MGGLYIKVGMLYNETFDHSIADLFVGNPEAAESSISSFSFGLLNP